MDNNGWNAKWWNIHRPKSVFEEYFPQMLLNFEEFHANPTEFLSVDNKVIVFGSYSGQTKKGTSFNVPFCHVYKIKSGKISQFKQFTDTKIIQDAIIG